MATMCTAAVLSWRLAASESLCGPPPPRLRPQPAPYRSRRRSSGPCSGSAPHCLPRPDDLRGEYGTDAKDLGEGSVGNVYLSFDALAFRFAIFRSSVRTLRARSPKPTSAGAGRDAALGLYTPRTMRAARWVESVSGYPFGVEVL